MPKRYLVALVVVAGALWGGEAGAATRTALCQVKQVAVLDNRVHVMCGYVGPYNQALNKSSNHPAYFAVAIGSPMAASLVALGTAAWQAQAVRSLANTSVCLGGGKHGAGYDPAHTEWFVGCNDVGANTIRANIVSNDDRSIVSVVYDDADLTGASFGCATQDCRKPLALYTGKIADKGD